MMFRPFSLGWGQACLARDAALEFPHALRAIAEGGIYLSHSLAETVFLARRSSLGPAPYGLTEREAEVLNFIGCGFSNKEIARRLALSVRTVETHRLNIRRKTGAARLRDLVRAARELGLEPVPAEAMASPPPALRHLALGLGKNNAIRSSWTMSEGCVPAPRPRPVVLSHA